MFARLQLSMLLPVTLALMSCANHPNVTSESGFSPNTGNLFNTFRGKLYFGAETSRVNQEGTELTQLVIVPDAVPFFAYQPITLSTSPNGTIAIRTDTSAVLQGRGPVQSGSMPDLVSAGELLPDFPQCSPSVRAVSTRPGWFSYLPQQAFKLKAPPGTINRG